MAKTKSTTEPATPAPPPAPTPSKLDIVVGLLQRPEGATAEALSLATGWQLHSVRGAMSGALKKKRGMTITSEKTDAGRIYRIAPVAEIAAEAAA
jgi:hypothetical protein